jgi:hypothetical protein
MRVKPLVFDLFCGLGGWTEAFMVEGYRCVGFDIEAHDYGHGGYPGDENRWDKNHRAEGYKTVGMNWSDRSIKGQDFTRIAGKRAAEGHKLPGNNSTRLWSDRKIQRLADASKHPFYDATSKSSARKQSSAEIAKIPFALASWIARTFRPPTK